jgi:hypothetical protein
MIRWYREARLNGYDIVIDPPDEIPDPNDEDSFKWGWSVYNQSSLIDLGKYVAGGYVDTEQEALDACQKWVDESIKE